jgi:hypothetical protein
MTLLWSVSGGTAELASLHPVTDHVRMLKVVMMNVIQPIRESRHVVGRRPRFVGKTRTTGRRTDSPRDYASGRNASGLVG